MINWFSYSCTSLIAALALSFAGSTVAATPLNAPGKQNSLEVKKLRVSTKKKASAALQKLLIANSPAMASSPGAPPVRTSGGGCELTPDDQSGCGGSDVYTYEFEFANWGGADPWASAVLEQVITNGTRTCLVTVTTDFGEADVPCGNIFFSPALDPIGITDPGKEGLGNIVDAVNSEGEVTPDCGDGLRAPSPIGPSTFGIPSSRPKTSSNEFQCPNVDTYQRCVLGAVALLINETNTCKRIYSTGSRADMEGRDACINKAQQYYEEDLADCRRQFNQ